MSDNITSPLDPDLVARIVMLVFGIMDDGNPYWCYVAVKRTRFDEFQQKMSSKKYNIQNFVADGFGEVIVSGDGVTPPPQVTRQVAQMAGVPIEELFLESDPKQFIDEKLAALNAALTAENKGG